MKSLNDYEKAKSYLGKAFVFKVMGVVLLCLSTGHMIISPLLTAPPILFCLSLLLLIIGNWFSHKFKKHMKDEK